MEIKTKRLLDVNKKTKLVLRDVLDSKEIDQKTMCFTHIKRQKPRWAFYLFPKIYKRFSQVSGRPAISNNDTIIESISEFV